MRRIFRVALVMALLSLVPFSQAFAAAATVSVTPASGAPGGMATAVVTLGSVSTFGIAKPQYLIGLYAAGAANNNYLFLENLATGTPQTLSFSLPSTTGQYQLRLWSLSRGVYSLLATSNTITVSAATPAFTPSNPAASGMQLTFDDEFNTLSAAHNSATTQWETNYYYYGLTQTTYFPWEPLDPAACNLGLTPFAINNGILTMTVASTAAALTSCGVTQKYTGAHLDTWHSFSQTYGYFEVRAKSSNVFGTGFAFWMLPEDGSWPPEIDAPEVEGRWPTYDIVTNHSGAKNMQFQFYSNKVDLSQDFHVYGVLWNSSTITWYLDGNVVGTTQTQTDEHKPFYMILEYGTGNCGDGWTDCPQTTTGFNATVQVDWVHAWQYSGGANPVVTPQAGFTGQ